jgi:hypothetical protein
MRRLQKRLGGASLGIKISVGVRIRIRSGPTIRPRSNADGNMRWQTATEPAIGWIPGSERWLDGIQWTEMKCFGITKRTFINQDQAEVVAGGIFLVNFTEGRR